MHPLSVSRRHATPLSRAAVAAVALLAVAGLSGCANQIGDAGASTLVPSASPSADPAPVVASRPGQALGGDCGSVFSDAEVAEMLNGEATPRTLDTEHDWAVETLGGVSCVWADDSDVATMRFTILPVSALAAVSLPADDEAWCYGGPEAGGDVGRCSLGEVTDGYWLSGIVGVRAGAERSALDLLDMVSERVDTAISAAPIEETVRPDASWSGPVDCDAVLTSAAPLLEGAFRADPSGGPAETPAGYIAALGAAGGGACTFYEESGVRWVELGTLPAGGWVVGEVAARDAAAAASVDGAVTAARVVDDRGELLVATDGPNLVWVRTSAGFAGGVPEAVAAPVFDAAR